MKPVVAGAVIRDPITMLPLPAEGGEVPESGDAGRFWVRRWLGGETWRREPDGEWVRRLPDGSTERAAVTPTGLEPLTPLTTR